MFRTNDNKMTNGFSLAPSFIASAFIHVVVLALASSLMTHQRNLSTQDFISVRLLQEPPDEKPPKRSEPPIAKRETPTPAAKTKRQPR